jgi:IS5 family transposase
MLKIPLPQQRYNLSDPQIESVIRDRISLLNFLGYTDKLTDKNIIWYFRERLSKTGKDRLVFNEIIQGSIESCRIHDETVSRGEAV